MTLAEVLALEYLTARQLPDGTWLAVAPQLFTVGLFVLEDEIGYRTRYCYANLGHALRAMLEWDGSGDPPGPWIKQKPPDRLNPHLKDEDFEEWV